jgi:hypothetical protein
MAEYKSKYVELMFYVNDQSRQFRNGHYKTDDKAEIEVLDGLVDVSKIESAPKAELKAEDKPKAMQKSSKK